MSERDERLDTLLALHLDALEPEEAARIRARVAADGLWRALDGEARKMLGILEDAAAAPLPPAGLAARTLRALTEREGAPAPPLSMRLAAAILGIAAIPILWMLTQWLLAGPPHASIVWKPAETVAAGGWFGPRVLVRDEGSGDPIEGASLHAVLTPKDGDPILLGEGRTDASGMLASGGWRLPDLPAGEAKLSIEAESGPRVEAPVYVTNEARLVASPDRRRVRPGERLRVRALLVTTDGAVPLAKRDLDLSLMDPNGNRVAIERRTTSRFGLAWADFPIDDEAPEGEWTLDVRGQGQVHVSTVTVRRDVLPSYRVLVRPDRRWVKPGEAFSAEISARTFDGLVVKNLSAEVIAGGSGGRKVKLADGTATVDLKAPDRAGPVRIDVRVSDAAGREGAGTATVSAATDPARVLVLPEAGDLVPGVSNRVYLVVRRVDGKAPGSATIEVMRKGRIQSLAADAQGVSVLEIEKPRAPAEVLSARAVVDGAPTSWTDVALEVRKAGSPETLREAAGSLLLRTDKALVEAGGTIEASVFSSRERGTVALDLRLDGRSVAVAGAELRGGVGSAKLHVPGGIQGLLTVHAAMLQGPDVWADRRVVLVRGSRDLRVQVSADRERYRPGETASLTCAVTDGDGRGVPSALSLVAVDEALLALTGDQGGLAQAWQELAGSGLRQPGADLDPDAIDDGTTPIAQATATALRPPDVLGVVTQLKDILPLDEMGPAYSDRIARFFEGADLSAEEIRYRDRILRSLREQGATATADALLRLSTARAAARTQGWTDTAPGERAEAEARRAAMLEKLRVALALLAVVVAAALLLRRATDPGQTLASLTLLWLGAGIALLAITPRHPGVGPWALLQAIVLFAQLRVALLIRGGARGTQIGLVCFEHVILALVLTSGQAELAALGIPALLIVAAVQATKRTVLGWVLTGITCMFVLCGLVVVLIPKSQEKAQFLEATNDARQIAGLLAARKDMAIGAAPTAMVAEPAALRPPRLREDFRETLLFAPEVVTDEQGRATVEVPVSDSLTGWRILADAIASKGGVAEGRTRINVSLPLSADLSLPAGGVIEGDEMDVRAVVSNHADEPTRIRVDLEVDGAERLGAGAREVEVPAHAVVPADFRVRFATPGSATLRVTAGDADRVERTVVVHRNARPVEFGETRRVTGDMTFAVRRPPGLSRDGLRGEVRVERGAIAPALEGLEAMLEEPHGCFEQTSSIHFPNVLVLRHLEQEGADPETLRHARDLVARGYQRLLGFEVERSGLFSLYGKPPGSLWLTAYGLLEFRATDPVHQVDPNLIPRIEHALLSRRQPDGSFPGDFGGVDGSINRQTDLNIAQTAYVVLALGDRAPTESCSWLLARRERIGKDPYLCALVSYALRKCEPAAAAQLASRLGALAARDGDRAHLAAETTLAWGSGRAASAEATAIGALALLDSGDQDLARKFLDAVVAARMPRGDWGSTHATAWALQALEQAASASKAPAPRTVVEVDGHAFELLAERPHAPFEFDPSRNDSTVRARVDDGPALVTVRGRGFAPWDSEVEGLRGPKLLVEWDRTELASGATALATILVSAGKSRMLVPMVELGLFAGAEPLEEDLDRLKSSRRIERWERSGNTVRLYLPSVNELQLTLRVRATARGTFTATPSRAWEYYRPDAMTTLRGARFAVR